MSIYCVPDAAVDPGNESGAHILVVEEGPCEHETLEQRPDNLRDRA